jgi:hypothetical protein
MNGEIEKIKTGQLEIDRMVQGLADSKKAQAIQNGMTDDQLGKFDPISDGAFDVKKYVNSPIKIMFIAREPNSPNDGGWDYKTVPINNDHFFGSMNAVANGILNNDSSVSNSSVLDSDAPIKNTVFINISKLPGGGQVGQQGTMAELYNENRSILEKDLAVYNPGIVICHNTAELCWPSLQKNLGFDDYTTKYFDRAGDEIPLGKNGQPMEAPTVAAYYCNNGKIIIDTFHPSSQRYGTITQEEWIKGIVNACQTRYSAFPKSDRDKKTSGGREKTFVTKKKQKAKSRDFSTGKSNSGKFFGFGVGSKGGGISFDPKIIGIIIGIIALVLLVLLLLRNCDFTKQKTDLPPLDPPTKPVILPVLTYDDIHFVKDTRFFLSQGNYHANMPPDMSEGTHDERLNKIALEIKNILAIKPEQIFVISGYAADIPGHAKGEMELSMQRSEKVKNILIELGVPSQNLECVYVGGTNRWGDNSSEETRKQNRVVTIELKE